MDKFCCMPLASRCGWSRKLCPLQTPPSTSRGVQSWLTVPGDPMLCPGPWVGSGCHGPLELHAKKKCVSVYPREEEPTASIGFPQGLRPVGSSESWSASTRQALCGPPNPPGWTWPRTQAGRGVLDPGVCPHALCPAPGRGHCEACFPAWFLAGHPIWAETGFGMSP